MTQPEPKQFQVIYRRTDNLIVGLSPKGGGVGPNNRLAVLHDMTEYQNLLRFNPAYLSADGDHIVNQSPNAST